MSLNNTNNSHHHSHIKPAVRLGFSDRSLLFAAALAGLITGAALMAAFTTAGRGDWPSSLLSSIGNYAVNPPPTEMQLKAIVHYATSKVVPQQSMAEITQSLNVLRSLSPCNFLVFGLGYDSLMWASLNPGGTTLFLEEDPTWFKTVLKDAPFLNAKTVPYRTKLKDADALLKGYKDTQECRPSRTFLKGNKKCPLALENLPEEVYGIEWDVIMIDAPKGYFPEAPGRMVAIFSAAVMARARKRPGVTHVFLHDVDRKVEKQFATEFLCIKNKVGGTGRLWHFEIPAAGEKKSGSTDMDTFC